MDLREAKREHALRSRSFPESHIQSHVAECLKTGRDGRDVQNGHIVGLTWAHVANVCFGDCLLTFIRLFQCSLTVHGL